MYSGEQHCFAFLQITALPHIGLGPRWVQGRRCSDWYINAVALLATEGLKGFGLVQFAENVAGIHIAQEGEAVAGLCLHKTPDIHLAGRPEIITRHGQHSLPGISQIQIYLGMKLCVW